MQNWNNELFTDLFLGPGCRLKGILGLKCLRPHPAVCFLSHYCFLSVYRRLRIPRPGRPGTIRMLLQEGFALPRGCAPMRCFYACQVNHTFPMMTPHPAPQTHCSVAAVGCIWTSTATIQRCYSRAALHYERLRNHEQLRNAIQTWLRIGCCVCVA